MAPIPPSRARGAAAASVGVPKRGSLLLFVLALSLPVRAQTDAIVDADADADADANAVVEQSVIIVVPEGSTQLPLKDLTEALQSQLAELDVGVRLSSRRAEAFAGARSVSDRTHDVLAFIWIRGTADALVVHFYEPAGASLKERHIPVSGTDAASIEEVAVVVRSATSALLERAASRTAPPLPPPRPPAVTPAPPDTQHASPLSPRIQTRLELSAAYAATRYAEKSPWQQGIAASAAWRPTSRWAVGAAYTWFPEFRHRTDDVTIVLNRHPAELFIGYEVPAGDHRARLRAVAALVADPLVRRTSRVSAELDSAPATTRWSWGASMQLRAAWALTPGLWLHASGGADLLVNRFESVIGGAAESPVLAPLRIRPRLQAGVAVDVP